ncbi:hypothetical protein AGLY_002589 [Aphis glycines]|uniref:Uncharacterized protein n=1 Tax=Aphis glycines TaxID=307491 RepID=A0A6G0U0N7_APHGL|nr:hypothetical protein AGLY_002589 [Aphis glycines]
MLAMMPMKSLSTTNEPSRRLASLRSQIPDIRTLVDAFPLPWFLVRSIMASTRLRLTSSFALRSASSFSNFNLCSSSFRFFSSSSRFFVSSMANCNRNSSDFRASSNIRSCSSSCRRCSSSSQRNHRHTNRCLSNSASLSACSRASFLRSANAALASSSVEIFCFVANIEAVMSHSARSFTDPWFEFSRLSSSLDTAATVCCCSEDSTLSEVSVEFFACRLQFCIVVGEFFCFHFRSNRFFGNIHFGQWRSFACSRRLCGLIGCDASHSYTDWSWFARRSYGPGPRLRWQRSKNRCGYMNRLGPNSSTATCWIKCTYCFIGFGVPFSLFHNIYLRVFLLNLLDYVKLNAYGNIALIYYAAHSRLCNHANYHLGIFVCVQREILEEYYYTRSD